MANLILCDPIGEAAKTKKQSVAIRWSPNKRIATLFNNHVSSYRFWKRLEELLKERLGGSVVATLAKENTFAPAPQEMITEIAETADLAIVGVGA